MQFEEYNGWPNFPTWDVFTVMTKPFSSVSQDVSPFHEIPWLLETLHS